jgi:hypothetical protein
MPSKKKVHLQQFGMIHLPNPDLIYITNPERNKILFVSFHLLKTYIRNHSLFFIYFAPSHLEETSMATTIRARIYTHQEMSFAKFLFLLS